MNLMHFPQLHPTKRQDYQAPMSVPNEGLMSWSMGFWDVRMDFHEAHDDFSNENQNVISH